MEQVSRAKGRNWMATMNNPEGDPETLLRQMSEAKGVSYVAGQLESGEEGTEHI